MFLLFQIKLINIHVTDIIDGNPSIILGLIWTIILHFHVSSVVVWKLFLFGSLQNEISVRQEDSVLSFFQKKDTLTLDGWTFATDVILQLQIECGIMVSGKICSVSTTVTRTCRDKILCIIVYLLLQKRGSFRSQFVRTNPLNLVESPSFEDPCSI